MAFVRGWYIRYEFIMNGVFYNSENIKRNINHNFKKLSHEKYISSWVGTYTIDYNNNYWKAAYIGNSVADKIGITEDHIEYLLVE